MSDDKPVPQIGDIWKELDARREAQRHVRVVAVGDEEARIYRVERTAGGEWVRPKRAPARCAALIRFDGRPWGYAFVERPPQARVRLSITDLEVKIEGDTTEEHNRREIEALKVMRAAFRKVFP